LFPATWFEYLDILSSNMQLYETKINNPSVSQETPLRYCDLLGNAIINTDEPLGKSSRKQKVELGLNGFS
jgi:hypothetical protein